MIKSIDSPTIVNLYAFVNHWHCHHRLHPSHGDGKFEPCRREREREREMLRDGFGKVQNMARKREKEEKQWVRGSSNL